MAHAAAVWLFEGAVVVEFATASSLRCAPGYVFHPELDHRRCRHTGIAGLWRGAWLPLRRNPSRTMQYFRSARLRFQIYFSLLYYPIFSLFLPIGDWRTIYDFAATPLLSGGTAVIHAALLLWFWRADRAGAFEMPAFDTAAEQAHYEATVGDGAQRATALSRRCARAARPTGPTALWLLSLPLIPSWPRGSCSGRCSALRGAAVWATAWATAWAATRLRRRGGRWSWGCANRATPRWPTN
jgi:hypothetical protein